nr:hypothetical protein [uncultured Fluviicola sp.]
MKPILLILLALSTHSVFSQSQYKITLTATGADNKNYLSALEDYVPDTYSRSTEDNLIQFSATTNYSVSDLDSLCRIAGIPFENIVKLKGPLPFREKVGGTNCGIAEQICSNTSLPGNSSGYGIQELSNANSGCLGAEHQSSWYYINVETGGSLSFRINPNSNSDYDFAVWGPFTSANAAANCPPVSGPVRCSYAQGNGNTGMRVGESDNSETQYGDRWVNALNVNASQIYILLIDNYSSSGIGYTFDFSWGGNSTTAVIGCTPVILPVEMSHFSGTYLSGSNVLSWSTETELNNDYFEIEWTTTPSNNNSWNKLDVVDGAGDSQAQIDYSINHYTYTRNAINYYRIKQVDYNGQTRSYPDIIAIDNRLKDQKLTKVVNLFGQEVSESEKGLVIYVYDDGTTEKRVN